MVEIDAWPSSSCSSNVGAVVQHVSRTGVAKDMGRKLLSKADLGAPLADDAECALAAEAPAPLVQEHRFGVAPAGPPIRRQLGATAAVEPTLQRAGGHTSEWNDPFLGTLPHQSHQTIVKIDVADRQPHDFRDPSASAVQGLEKRCVSTADRVIALNPVDQRSHRSRVSALGSPFGTEDLDVGGQVVGPELVRNQETMHSRTATRSGSPMTAPDLTLQDMDEGEDVVRMAIIGSAPRLARCC